MNRPACRLLVASLLIFAEGCGEGDSDRSKVIPATDNVVNGTSGASSPRDLSTTKNIPMH